MKQNSIDTIFSEGLPETLFMDHYTLSDHFPAFTPIEWRTYLRDNEAFILKELSYITEANARSSLKRIGEGNIKSGDASTIKQLLDRSEMINKNTRQEQTFVTMFVPNPNDLKDPYKKEVDSSKIFQINRENVTKLYNLKQNTRFLHDQRIQKGEIVQNADYTLHFPKPEKITALDQAYINLFNPENEYRTSVPDVELERDWQ